MLSSFVETMRFFVRLIAFLLDENRLPDVESRMRNATHTDYCSHDVSVCSSRLPFDGINMLKENFSTMVNKFFS